MNYPLLKALNNILQMFPHSETLEYIINSGYHSVPKVKLVWTKAIVLWKLSG